MRKLFGLRVRQLRSDQQLTVAELALMMERDKSMVAHLEGGRNAPNLDTLGRLAEALGVDEKDLLNFPKLSVRNEVVELTRRVPEYVLLEVQEILVRAVEELERESAERQERLAQRTAVRRPG